MENTSNICVLHPPQAHAVSAWVNVLQVITSQLKYWQYVTYYYKEKSPIILVST